MIAALLSAGERLPAELHAATRSDLLVLDGIGMVGGCERLVRQVHRIVRPPGPDPRNRRVPRPAPGPRLKTLC